MFYYDWIYILLGLIVLPGIILGVIAQSKVNVAYNKYSKIFASRDIKASIMARKVLDAADLKEVQIIKVSGKLTDYYNKKDKVLALSDGVYESSSLSALGIAAHEIGHALQDKENYIPLKLRGLFGGISIIGNYLLFPMISLSILFALIPITNNQLLSTIFACIGFGLFGFSILFSLITLPIEINASKRTDEILKSTGLLNEEEYQCVKKVLRAAAWTYVAALIISILSFIRILFWFLINAKRAKD